MSFRGALFVVFGISVVAPPTAAAQETDALDNPAPIFDKLERYLPSSQPAHAPMLLPSGDAHVLPAEHRGLRRPDTFESLCLSFVGLTIVDTITTARALHDGTGRELNPALAPFASNTGALVATKAAIDVAVIYLARKLWHHDKQSGINVMIGANAISGVAVIKNLTAGQPQVPR